MNAPFGGTYAGRRVLVTGHTGFKGSWLCLWLESLGAQVTGLALDPETSPAHWDLLELEGVQDHRVDVRDAARMRQVVLDTQPEMIFHLAAQALVRRSYQAPESTFSTNVTGLVNLLETVRSCSSVRVVVNVTTDKVYREDPLATGGYREDDPLGGHDPYSSSKACAELVSDCYRKSFFHEGGPRLATARAGNVVGGGDWSEDRLVPDLVRAATAGQRVRIRNPDAIRPWQHVLEPLSGYLRLGQSLLESDAAAGAWNFGPSPDSTLTVHELVSRMKAHWPGLESDPSPGPHPHEAGALRLDCTKAARGLDWQPVWDAATTIDRTMAWYRAFHQSGTIGSREDLASYVADARDRGMAWTR